MGKRSVYLLENPTRPKGGHPNEVRVRRQTNRQGCPKAHPTSTDTGRRVIWPRIHRANRVRSVLPSKNLRATRSMRRINRASNLHRFELNWVSIGIRMLKHNQSGTG